MEAKLIPRTLHATIGSEGRTRYCGVWGRPAGVAITGGWYWYWEELEGQFEQIQADLSGQLLIDVAISGAGKPQATRERAQADLQDAEKKLETKPEDIDSRLARALANVRRKERISRHSMTFSS